MTINLAIAALLGLFSSVHCLGMCGGIIGALSMGLPDQVRDSRYASSIMVCAYNLGRITSYACAGLIIGSAAFLLPGGAVAHSILQMIAAVVLVGLGMHLGGWLPRWSQIESFGARVWRLIQPLGRHLLPVNSPLKALLMGMLWGWLPCGLVYSVLLWAGASGGPVSGALIMLSFGVGTLPGMIAAGLAAGALRQMLRRAALRRGLALIVIVFGLASPWLHLATHGDSGAAPMSHMHH